MESDMVKVIHKPIFDTLKIEDHYSKKDGVPVKYVCTSAPGNEAQAMDIFYRETPHPEFGNHYFGLYYDTIRDHMMITNADMIEDLEFACIEDSKGDLHYSAHRHDYKVLDNDNMIDGGRSYIRWGGEAPKVYQVIDGEFVEKKDDR